MSEWRRWQMGALESDRPPPRDTEPCRPAAEQRHRAVIELEEQHRRHQALEQAREEGYRQGYESGLEAGHSEGLARGREQGQLEYREQTRAELAPLAELVQTFHEALQQLDEEVTDELVTLALETGRQLAGEALKARPHQVAALVRKLLNEESLLGEEPRLWLHPVDLELVARELGDEFEAAGWTLQADETLSRGGCRVTSDSGEMDATRENRWRSLLARVRAPRARRAASARKKPARKPG